MSKKVPLEILSLLCRCSDGEILNSGALSNKTIESEDGELEISAADAIDALCKLNTTTVGLSVFKEYFESAAANILDDDCSFESLANTLDELANLARAFAEAEAAQSC